ncbi:MAG: hypothetical protein JEY97_09595 [Bacteroidales bacterium]|nr:hypothetical protein [Bacteroidales bacterium]
MNFITILSVLLTGFGTLILSLNLKFRKFGVTFFKIIGVILIASGTILVIIDSSSSMTRISENIENFREELNVAKQNSLATNNIQEISNKFEKWAKNLSKNKEQKKIDFKKKILSSEEKRLKANKKIKLYLNYIIEFIRNSIVSYNKETNFNIKFDFDSIPTDFLSNEAYVYKSYFLTDKYLWRLSFCCKSNISEVDLPFFLIDSKNISNISELDTISNIRLLASHNMLSDDDFAPFQLEFRVAIMENSNNFKWRISQEYGNTKTKIIEDLIINHSEFYNEIDKVLFEIIDYMLLN